MPHKVTWETKGAYWRFYGTVTPQDVEEANSEAYGDERFDQLKYIIWDFSDIIFEATAEDADMSAGTDYAASTYKQGLKYAVVTKDEEVRKIVGCYFDTSLLLGSNWKFELFENIEDARKWVSI